LVRNKSSIQKVSFILLVLLCECYFLIVTLDFEVLLFVVIEETLLDLGSLLIGGSLLDVGGLLNLDELLNLGGLRGLFGLFIFEGGEL